MSFGHGHPPICLFIGEISKAMSSKCESRTSKQVYNKEAETMNESNDMLHRNEELISAVGECRNHLREVVPELNCLSAVKAKPRLSLEGLKALFGKPLPKC